MRRCGYCGCYLDPDEYCDCVEQQGNKKSAPGEENAQEKDTTEKEKEQCTNSQN